MRQSMTGFATAHGSSGAVTWAWELRGVNGKGLDVRLRVPDGVDGLEADLRARVQARIARGSVTATLKLSSADEAGAPSVNEAALAAVLEAVARIEAEAMARGVALAPATPAQIAGLRGVLETATATTDPDRLRADVTAGFAEALDAFVAMRAEEGRALQALLEGHLDTIAGLAAEARTLAAERAEAQRERLSTQLARVLDNADGIDEARLAQELALIAVKSDVTEEIDRLEAHVAAARKLIAGDGAVGRKLDFLMQEFNREANTLCAKAGAAELTNTGLALKTEIDRMREQVQNVE